MSMKYIIHGEKKLRKLNNHVVVLTIISMVVKDHIKINEKSVES